MTFLDDAQNHLLAGNWKDLKASLSAGLVSSLLDKPSESQDAITMVLISCLLGLRELGAEPSAEQREVLQEALQALKFPLETDCALDIIEDLEVAGFDVFPEHLQRFIGDITGY